MKNDILGLKISMDDVVVVHVLGSIANLSYDRPYFVLRNGARIFEMLVKIASATELHQQIEVIILNEG